MTRTDPCAHAATTTALDLPLTNETVCHRCYRDLLSVLTVAEQRDLRREPRDPVECDEKRDALWRRLMDDSTQRFSLLELD